MLAEKDGVLGPGMVGLRPALSGSATILSSIDS